MINPTSFFLEKEIIYPPKWCVFLNMTYTGYEQIGIHTHFWGNREYRFQKNDIIIIGYGRIYNEMYLWKHIDKTPESSHPLEIIAELYNRYEFNHILELLDGEYSFILLDYNIRGEESFFYIARDPFCTFPMYEFEYPSKKNVEFIDTIKKYGFTSDPLLFDSHNISSDFPGATYSKFTHSFKVSAAWKSMESNFFFRLPLINTNIHLNHKTDNYKIELLQQYQTKIKLSIQKRIQYIELKQQNTEKEEIGYFGIYANDFIKNTTISSEIFDSELISKIKILTFDQPPDYFFSLDSVVIDKEYPNLITKLKHKYTYNDPQIIRFYLIPILFAKQISDKYPTIKYVFLELDFILQFFENSLEMDILKKDWKNRKNMNEIHFSHFMKGWVHAFLEYEIKLFIPFLDKNRIEYLFSIPPEYREQILN